jgi:hypothetical protein
VDELHAHRTRKVFDVLETATGARSQPLLWLITTAGFDRSGICYEQRTYLTKILDEVVKDDTYFGVIYTIDDGDDWSDPKVWAKANPNYGVSVQPDDIGRLCVKALKMPSAQNNFLTKRLSVWVNADSAFFSMTGLAKCADWHMKPEDFRGEPCWIGIDLASRRDIAPRVQLFRRGGHFYCFARYFLPESEIENSKNSQYSGCARQEGSRSLLRISKRGGFMGWLEELCEMPPSALLRSPLVLYINKLNKSRTGTKALLVSPARRAFLSMTSTKSIWPGRTCDKSRPSMQIMLVGDPARKPAARPRRSRCSSQRGRATIANRSATPFYKHFYPKGQGETGDRTPPLQLSWALPGRTLVPVGAKSLGCPA